MSPLQLYPLCQEVARATAPWGMGRQGGRTEDSPAEVTAQIVRRHGGDEARPKRSLEASLVRVRTKPVADKQVP